MNKDITLKEFIEEICKEEHSEELKIASEIATIDRKEIKIIPLSKVIEAFKEFGKYE